MTNRWFWERVTILDAFRRANFSNGRQDVADYSHRPCTSKHLAPSSNPTTSTAKPPVSPGKTKVARRLWRLTGRLTRYQGSALDDAACASMHVHGRAGKPKQLARYAKNPGKTRVLGAEREGFEPSVPLPVHRFSRPAHSAALSPLRKSAMRNLKITP